MMQSFGRPAIPSSLMHTMAELRQEVGEYDADNGGQTRPGTIIRIDFQGCVLPVSETDLQKAPQGTYTKDSRKIYTNGAALAVGTSVFDPEDGATYLITGDLNHGSIHPMRRYIAERKGVAAPR